MLAAIHLVAFGSSTATSYEPYDYQQSYAYQQPSAYRQTRAGPMMIDPSRKNDVPAANMAKTTAEKHSGFRAGSE
jgi:hypothetical protein